MPRGRLPRTRVTRALIMGAAGRDFHNFNVAFRDDPSCRVVAFTAAQIPGIAGRRYPVSLAGPQYPQGVPIHPEEELESLIRRHRVDWVYFSYSDVSHIEVMHRASRVLAAGAGFALLGPARTMLKSQRPVISVGAVRTGAGKSPLSQRIAGWLRERGRRVVVLRHPMPYGDLERQAVQRFASWADLDAAETTVEEREEYEPYVAMGVPVFAGVDYAQILERAEEEAEVIVWDGGNNDVPFLRSELHLMVLDPYRAGDEHRYHPGEVNLRTADAYVVTKVDSATTAQVAAVRRSARAIKPRAPVILADLALSVADPEAIRGKRVVVVGDGPTLTHGGMSSGAGTLAAARYGAAVVVDPRLHAVGELRDTFESFLHLEREVPAMGYTPGQVADLQATIDAVPVDVVIDATPVDLARLIRVGKPMVRVDYRLHERGPALGRLLERFDRRYLST